MRRSNPASLLAALVLLGSMLVLGACGSDNGSDGGSRPAGDTSLKLTIGDSVPLSGDLARFGLAGRKAADLAGQQVQKAITQNSLDHSVSIEHEDNKAQPRAAAQAARKLVAANATCLAGAWAPDDTLRTAREVTIPEGILEISPATTDDRLTLLDDAGLVNRTVPADSSQGPALADAIEQALGGSDAKTINVGARDDPYGRGLIGSFARAWRAKGGRIGTQVVYDPKQAAYHSEARRLVQGDPDAWAIFDFPQTYAKVGPALVRTGKWDPRRTFVTDGLASSSLPGRAGADATEGLRGTAPGAPDKGVAADAFDKLYESSPGPGRETFDAQNFDAVVLCYLAAVAAGNPGGKEMAAQVRAVSAPPGRKYTWQQLPAAVNALMDGDDIDYDGASGPIDMDAHGDPTAGFYSLFRFRDGKVVVFDQLRLRP